MIRDPGTGWDGPFPYDELAAVATWRMSHADIQKVPFALMRRRLMTPRTQQAWETLRTPRSRMLVDLFLYDVVDDADTEAAAYEEAQAGGVPDAVATLCDAVVRFDT